MCQVLVVDDDPDMRFMLSLKLDGNDRELLMAEDGHEGLEIALRERPALVVLDYRMPGPSGIDVARQLLEAGFEGQMVVFSAHVTGELQREIDALQLMAFSKTDLTELVHVVDTVAARHREAA